MTEPHNAGLVPVALALGMLAACAPRPRAAAPPTPAPQAAAPPPATPPPATSAPATPAPAPQPARHAHMVCRSSRDGRPIPCGTPDAMMVGIKED